MRVRNTKLSDAPAIVELQRRAFPSFDPDTGHWKERHIEAHLARFPEGQFVAEDETGRIVGSATSLCLPKARVLRPHTWKEATGDGFFRTHDPNGDTLYAADVCVDPTTQGMGVGRALYRARRKLARERQVAGIVSGGRIPGYGRVADELTPEEYVEEVVRGKRRDPVLSFQLANGFRVIGILRNYLRDPKSRNFATHIAWWNPQPRGLRVPARGHLGNGAPTLSKEVTA